MGAREVRTKARADGGGRQVHVLPVRELVLRVVCGVKGANLNDGEPMLECEKCKVWHHTLCNRVP